MRLGRTIAAPSPETTLELTMPVSTTPTMIYSAASVVQHTPAPAPALATAVTSESVPTQVRKTMLSTRAITDTPTTVEVSVVSIPPTSSAVEPINEPTYDSAPTRAATPAITRKPAPQLSTSLAVTDTAAPTFQPAPAPSTKLAQAAASTSTHIKVPARIPATRITKDFSARTKVPAMRLPLTSPADEAMKESTDDSAL